MRRFVYILVMLVCLSACSSVSKMIEKGDYDRAFNYTVNKLVGEKKKKTEYVKALEKAYDKLNTNSLNEIYRLNANNRSENWPRVLELYKSMDNRQRKLDPLLPLTSVEGYVAYFDMKGYRNEIFEAEDKTCEYYYSNALSLIDRSEKTGDKIAAKNALAELQKIDKIRKNYRDIQLLMDKAYALGITKVSIRIFNELRDFHSDNIERSLNDMSLAALDKTWIDYGYNIQSNKTDYIVEVELIDIFFTPERERMHTYSESKEVLVSKDKVKDNDSTYVEKQVYEKVKADITEIFREKQSELRGNIRVVDARTNKILKTTPINVFHDFKGYSCTYLGDKRAITNETNKKLDNFLEPFPTDFFMSDNLAAAFKDAVIRELKQFKF